MYWCCVQLQYYCLHMFCLTYNLLIYCQSSNSSHPQKFNFQITRKPCFHSIGQHCNRHKPKRKSYIYKIPTFLYVQLLTFLFDLPLNDVKLSFLKWDVLCELFTVSFLTHLHDSNLMPRGKQICSFVLLEIIHMSQSRIFYWFTWDGLEDFLILDVSDKFCFDCQRSSKEISHIFQRRVRWGSFYCKQFVITSMWHAILFHIL